MATPDWSNDVIEGTTGITTQPSGAARVQESIDFITDALAALGDRDRAGCKAMLVSRRAALQAKLDRYLALGTFMRGPAAVDLISKYVSAQNAVTAAKTAMLGASRDTVLARRTDLDMAEADARDAARSFESLPTELRFPKSSLIDPTIFANAKSNTKALAFGMKRTVALLMALQQANPWPKRSFGFCFEVKDSEAYQIRWAHFVAMNPDAGLTAAP